MSENPHHPLVRRIMAGLNDRGRIMSDEAIKAGIPQWRGMLSRTLYSLEALAKRAGVKIRVEAEQVRGEASDPKIADVLYDGLTRQQGRIFHLLKEADGKVAQFDAILSRAGVKSRKALHVQVAGIRRAIPGIVIDGGFRSSRRQAGYRIIPAEGVVMPRRIDAGAPEETGEAKAAHG